MNDIYNFKLMIVDDEPALRTMLKDILQGAGFQRVITAADCKQARRLFESEAPHCLILDVMLPDGDSFTLLREFRAESAVPALFLTARDEDEDRLTGLRLGADDYITKPFLPQELILRLQAVLKRTYFPAVQQQVLKPVFRLGDTQVDLNSGTVIRDDQQQTLTAKEYALLEKLYENRGRIVTGDSLCQAAWQDNLYSYENTLMVHIRRLREKLEPQPSTPIYLLTVRGLGYKLIGDDTP